MKRDLVWLVAGLLAFAIGELDGVNRERGYYGGLFGFLRMKLRFWRGICPCGDKAEDGYPYCSGCMEHGEPE